MAKNTKPPVNNRQGQASTQTNPVHSSPEIQTNREKKTAQAKPNFIQRHLIVPRVLTFVILWVATWLLYLVMSTFPLQEAAPFLEWLEYKTTLHHPVLFVFSLLFVSGFFVVGGLQSIIKDWRERAEKTQPAEKDEKTNGEPEKKAWPAPFGLSFGVILVCFIVSLLTTVSVITSVGCEVPYVTFHIQNNYVTIHPETNLPLPVGEWVRIKAFTESTTNESLMCFWETKGDLQISQKKSCTIYVRLDQAGSSTLTLKAHTETCGNPERIGHLFLNFSK